jgi:enoyl-CoA hydratase/carnithine racemase
MTLVRLEREEPGLAIVTLDSPPLNLFNRQMFEGLRDAVSAAATS